MAASSPPFTALRAVEAASRHRSYTWAAKELQVTHSAVSQSIKRLEAELGATLFTRQGGAMHPSDAAIRLARIYAEAAGALDQAIREVAQMPDADLLAVAMSPDFGRLWFANKLGRLAEAMPDVSFQARTKASRIDSPALGVEIRSPRPDEETITQVSLLPVCSPTLFASGVPKAPGDVICAPLLATDDANWSEWAEHFGLAINGRRTHRFDDVGVALDAAAQGAGVLLTHLFLAESHIESGRLAPLPFVAPTDRSLILMTHGPVRPELAERFGLWLRLEVSRSRALLDGRLKG